MKRLILSISVLAALAQAQAATTAMRSAEEPADTTASADVKTTDLSEVVVEGRTQRVVKFGVEYTPDKKTKRAAMDATNLLHLMAIPQLETIPGSTKVTMTGGRDVSVFIDYQPSTAEELKGLRPEDVLRVEVLEYPQDPRFQSAQYVVNFIMQKYEWGGYTKLYVQGQPLPMLNTWGSLYSKFAYKNWTFDVNAGASGTRDHKQRSFTRETFRDFDFNGQHIDELDRTSTTDNYLMKHNGEWASLRAVYASRNAYLSHTLYLNRSDIPSSSSRSAVDFSLPILPSSEAFSDESNTSISPGLSAHYYFALPKGNTIVADWSFSFSNGRRNSSYRLGNLDPIINDNREKIYVPNVNLSYSKSLHHNNTFRTSMMTYNSIYDTRYDGSYTDRQKLLSSENMLFLEYMQNWAFGLSLYSRIGMSYVVGRVNGVNTLKQWNPRLGAQLRYNINQNHNATLSAWWGNSHPGPESSNTAFVQQNELIWLRGNPDIRNTIFQQVDASYNFIPNNRFSFSLYAKYEGNPDKQAYEYMVIPGYDGLVRRMINSGSAHDWTLNLSGSARLLNGNLSLRAGLGAERVVLTGIDARSLNNLTANISANYFLKKFTFSAYYSSPRKYLGAWSRGTVTSLRSSYGLTVNFAAGDFRASLSTSNWFNSNRSYSDFTSPHYSSNGWSWTGNTAHSLSLSLTYTFSYGKKISREDEVSGSSSPGSAILK